MITSPEMPHSLRWSPAYLSLKSVTTPAHLTPSPHTSPSPEVLSALKSVAPVVTSDTWLCSGQHADLTGTVH